MAGLVIRPLCPDNLTARQLMRVEGGRVVEIRGHSSDEATLAAFWGTRDAADEGA